MLLIFSHIDNGRTDDNEERAGDIAQHLHSALSFGCEVNVAHLRLQVLTQLAVVARLAQCALHGLQCQIGMTGHGTLQDNVAARREVQKAALMQAVATYEQICHSIQDETHTAEHHHWYGQMHRILVIDVDQRLQCLHNERKGQRGQDDEHNQHGEYINACPAEGVPQLHLSRLTLGQLLLLRLAQRQHHGDLVIRGAGIRNCRGLWCGWRRLMLFAVLWRQKTRREKRSLDAVKLFKHLNLDLSAVTVTVLN